MSVFVPVRVVRRFESRSVRAVVVREVPCLIDEDARTPRGELGHHYRLGWEEKRKTGHSLVEPDVEHRYNLPEGYRYDYGGRGLVTPPKKGSP